MPSGTAPSAGTKVTMGKDAPYASEATGAVASDSLAAESQAFRQNNEGAPQAYPHESLTGASSQPASKPAPASSGGAAPASAGTAPSYVQNVYHQDKSGPHGKNIHEDDSIATEDKNKNASFSEFGTENDPARLAEKKFTLADQAPASSIGQRQHHVTNETRFDALGEENA